MPRYLINIDIMAEGQPQWSHREEVGADDLGAAMDAAFKGAPGDKFPEWMEEEDAKDRLTALSMSVRRLPSSRRVVVKRG